MGSGFESLAAHFPSGGRSTACALAGVHGAARRYDSPSVWAASITERMYPALVTPYVSCRAVLPLRREEVGLALHRQGLSREIQLGLGGIALIVSRLGERFPA